jgi:uncharacterized membrane protein
MTWLVIGLVLFLGAHSVRIAAPGVRSAALARLGEGGWKGLYSVVSLVGFGLLIWGYGLARGQPVILWTAPLWLRHVASLLILGSFVLVVAAYVPRNHVKAAVGHPMVAGVKLWAFAHLLAHGWLPGVLLFGAFLAWAVLAFVSMRKRDRAAGVVYPSGQWPRTVVVVVVGAVLWAVFAFWLHGALIGIRPLG